MTKLSKNAQTPQCDKTAVISRCYGFEIGKRMIEVKAISEKHALLQIVNKYWELIDDAGEVKLLGEGVRNGL